MEFWVASENATWLPPKAPVPVCPGLSSLPPAWSCRRPQHHRPAGNIHGNAWPPSHVGVFIIFPTALSFPGSTCPPRRRALAGT